MTRSSAMQITPNEGVVGVVVAGANLSEILLSDERQTLLDLLWQHQLLIFRNQSLKPQEHEQLAQIFGTLRVPNPEQCVTSTRYLQKVVKNANDKHNFGGTWHADGSFYAHPPRATVIHGIELPPKGGDTLFADCISAYATLSLGMKMLLSDLKAVHQAHGITDPSTFVEGQAISSEDALLSAHHPVVGQHPHTLKKYLYVNQTFTQRFTGMTTAESRGLLDFLTEHIVGSEKTYRHEWQEQDLLIWDNRTTQHCALNDYHGYRRIMHRAVALA